MLPALPQAFGVANPGQDRFKLRFNAIGTLAVPLVPHFNSPHLSLQRNLLKTWKEEVLKKILHAVVCDEGDFVRRELEQGSEGTPQDVALHNSVTWWVMMEEVARIVTAIRNATETQEAWSILELFREICREDAEALNVVNRNQHAANLGAFLEATGERIQEVAADYFTWPAIQAANDTRELVAVFEPLLAAMKSCRLLSATIQGRNPYPLWRVWICRCWLKIERTTRFKLPTDNWLVSHLRTIVTKYAGKLRAEWALATGPAPAHYVDVLPKPETIAQEVKVLEDHRLGHRQMQSLTGLNKSVHLTNRKRLVYNDLE